MPKSKRLARGKPAPPQGPGSGGLARKALARAIRAHKAGDLVAAERQYRLALRQSPGDVDAPRLLSRLLLSTSRAEEALDIIARAARRAPDDPAIQAEHAAILRETGRLSEAVAACRRALAREPDHQQALLGLGLSLTALGQPDDALVHLRRAAALAPRSSRALANLAQALADAGDMAAADEVAERAVALGPDDRDANVVRGFVHARRGRLDGALAAYRRARDLSPGTAALHANVAAALASLGRTDEAAAAYEAALGIEPENAFALTRLGAIRARYRDFDGAIGLLRRAVAADPSSAFARHELCEAQRAACDWTDLEDGERELRSLARKSAEPLPPFSWLTLGGSPADQLDNARRWARQIPHDPDVSLPPRRTRTPGERIRIGYLSSDFHAHATAFLAAELFERHDRDRFHVVAYSHGPDDGSAMRRRLLDAFDDFVDVEAIGDGEVASRIRADGIDILVDLKGYTKDARTGILAHRPAPVQVNFLGYPGTTGADFVDYIVADPVVVPEGADAFYSEAVVRLPHCYQPNDTRRPIASPRPTRTDCGLPDDGVVFACFNHTYKITPAVFAVWMRLLRDVPGSVLWLLESNATARANLTRQAQRHGIAPQRILFAKARPLDEHLARMTCADIFLDTLPVNAHTTASDALWAGLPVVTCTGEAMVSRVAASLLSAVGLPDLVTRSLEDYEALALELARSPRRRAALRAHLASEARSAPLFDIALFTRNLEKAFVTMHEASLRGDPPRAITVAEEAPADRASAGTGTRPQSETCVPRTINLGSGKAYREDCLNIDVDGTWGPDAVVDISQVDLSAPLTIPSPRFGAVVLAQGAFDRIIANDVLEHVPDLVTLMTNCLALLREGGLFDISVPYDLSHGAWQDPTHVRAFNERSWLYYTDWFWYLGWSQARFVTESLSLVPSPLGRELMDKGASHDELARTPRAIDSMSVRLRKARLSADDEAAWERWRASRQAAASRHTGAARNQPTQRAAPLVRSDPESPPRAFEAGWEAHREAHCVWIVSPEDYPHHRAFDDVAAGLSTAFAELRGSAPLVRRPEEWAGRTPIVFGANLLPAGAHLPEGSVVMNLEQAGEGNGWFSPEYLDLLRRHPVLDYSARNARALAAAGIDHARILPVGFAPCLARVAHRTEKDIDVLFYGSLNERRRSVLGALEEAGIAVVHRFGVYGAERDDLIGRARIVLNMHYYDSAVFEVVRVSYLMANAACVVTEGEREDEDLAPFAEGLAVTDREGIVDTCRALLADPGRRAALGGSALSVMLDRRQSALLADLIGLDGDAREARR